MIADLSALYARDLNKLMAELEAYASDGALWTVRGEIANSAGNLALHLTGNLSQFVGDDLGGVPFLRESPAEFSRRDVPRAELLAGLKRTLQVVQETLAGLDETQLDYVNQRQLPGFPENMTTRFFLIHLYGHLNYHLGQINDHRRLTVSRLTS